MAKKRRMAAGALTDYQGGWDYNLTQNRVRTPHPDQDNYYQSYKDKDPNGNWVLVIESENNHRGIASAPGPSGQSFLVNGPGSPATMKWIKHIDEFQRINWSVNMKLDFLTQSHPGSINAAGEHVKEFFTWMVLMDHKNLGGGKLPKPDQLLTQVLVKHDAVLPNAEVRATIGWSGSWGGKQHNVEITFDGGYHYSNNEGLVKRLTKANGGTFLQLDGSQFGVWAGAKREQWLLVPWYTLLPEFTRRGWLPKPTQGWGSTATDSVLIGHELHIRELSGAGQSSLWFTNFRNGTAIVASLP